MPGREPRSVPFVGGCITGVGSVITVSTDDVTLIGSDIAARRSRIAFISSCIASIRRIVTLSTDEVALVPDDVALLGSVISVAADGLAVDGRPDDHRSRGFLSPDFERFASRFSLSVLPTFLLSRRCGDLVMQFLLRGRHEARGPRRWWMRKVSLPHVARRSPVEHADDLSRTQPRWRERQRLLREHSVEVVSTWVSCEQGLRGGDRIVSTTNVERQKRSPVSQ